MSETKQVLVSTKTETPPQVVYGELYSYRYAYARAADTRADGDMGQDYLTFVGDENCFSFALCDGVSQSFFGDLAAQHLGNALLHWLQKVSSTTRSSHLQESLEIYLNDLSGLIHKKVQDHPLPDDTPGLIRSVLEEKRDLGSEATFVCGRIEQPSKSTPHGQALFAWLGDSRLRLWNQNSELSQELGDTFHTDQRWSTKRGLVNSKPHIFRSALIDLSGQRSLDRIMTYSDGLSQLDNVDHVPSNYMLKNIIAQADSSPNSDDISYLEIWIGEVPKNVNRQPTHGIPHVILEKRKDQLVALSWKPVIGADFYRVRIHNQEDRYIKTPEASWLSEPLSPGIYTFQVQAVKENGEPGKWSKLVSEEISVPEPQESIRHQDTYQRREISQVPVNSKRIFSRAGTSLIAGLVAAGFLSLLGLFVYFSAVVNPPPTPSATIVFNTQPAGMQSTQTPYITSTPMPTETTHPSVTPSPNAPATDIPSFPIRPSRTEEINILPYTIQ